MSIEEMSNNIKLSEVHGEYKTAVMRLIDVVGNLDGLIQQIESMNTYNITASKEEIEDINKHKEIVKIIKGEINGTNG